MTKRLCKTDRNDKLRNSVIDISSNDLLKELS